jgi:SOS response regulatory protein OraA/RecX
VPTVTALRAERGGRLRVELDGLPWRTLPAEAVLAAGLGPGVELDRVRAAALNRQRRRVEALARAAALLARRDGSAAGLGAALARRGVAPAAREQAITTLTRVGVVDEQRFAAQAAASLARRGYGDEAIRFRLCEEGVAASELEQALAGLEPEAERARTVAERLGGGARAARYLAAHGFDPDTVADLLGLSD